MKKIGRRHFLGAGVGSVAFAVVPLLGCSSGASWPPTFRLAGPTAVSAKGVRFQTRANDHTLVITDREGRERVVGGLGTAQGRLNYPVGVALIKELAYVVECGNHRVQVFDAAGNSVGLIGVGELFHPGGITASGTEIFVADSRNGRIVAFTPDGAVTRRLGTGVLSAPRGLAMLDDDLLVADPGLRKVLDMGLDGRVRAELGSGWVLPWSVATDGEYVFVADTSRLEITVLSRAGARLDAIAMDAAAGYVSFRDDALYVV